jgi:ribonuclease J
MAGEMLRLMPGEARIVDDAPGGRLHVDGRLIVPSVEGPGPQAAQAVISLVWWPCRWPSTRRASWPTTLRPCWTACRRKPTAVIEFHELVLDATEDLFDAIPRKRRQLDDVVSEALRLGIRRRVETEWGKKPIVHVLIHRV